MAENKWRRLEEGEIVLATDEIYDDAKDAWVPPTNSIGHKAPSPLYTSHRQFRRKIDTPCESYQEAVPPAAKCERCGHDESDHFLTKAQCRLCRDEHSYKSAQPSPPPDEAEREREKITVRLAHSGKEYTCTIQQALDAISQVADKLANELDEKEAEIAGLKGALKLAAETNEKLGRIDNASKPQIIAEFIEEVDEELKRMGIIYLTPSRKSAIFGLLVAETTAKYRSRRCSINETYGKLAISGSRLMSCPRWNTLSQSSKATG